MSLQQLKEELKENLEHKGVLNQVRAKLRASIFQVISSASSDELIPSKQSQSQILLHLLMLDYMKWIGYKFSASIFEQEASIGGESEFSREFLAKEIGLKGYKDTDIPVLYALLQKIMREQKGAHFGEAVTDSLEYLKEAWLKHDQQSSYEEYETKLEGSSGMDETGYTASETTGMSDSENQTVSSEDANGETEDFTDEDASGEGDTELGEDSQHEDKPYVFKR